MMSPSFLTHDPLRLIDSIPQLPCRRVGTCAGCCGDGEHRRHQEKRDPSDSVNNEQHEPCTEVPRGEQHARRAAREQSAVERPVEAKEQ